MEEKKKLLMDYLQGEDAADEMMEAILDLEDVYPETVELFKDIPEKKAQIISAMATEAEILHGYSSELITDVLSDDETFNAIFDKIVGEVKERLIIVEYAEDGYDIDQD